VSYFESIWVKIGEGQIKATIIDIA